jgi:hypothetical protein
MAKKNRRSGPVQTKGGRPPSTPGARVAPAEPGGPNRQARKEEARRQREVIQRKMARRRYYRLIGVITAVVVVAGAVAVYAVTRPDPAEAADCGSIQVVKQFPGGNDRAHIGAKSSTGSEVVTAPPLSAYPSTPPVSGPHNPTPLSAGVYSTPPDVYRTIHSLEHGAVVIWYAPGTTSSELSKIQDFYRNSSNSDHVIVAPYSYPDQGAAGKLPAGKQMVMVAWHHVESCGQLSLGAVQDFVKHYRTLTGLAPTSAYEGDAPEAGVAI